MKEERFKRAKLMSFVWQKTSSVAVVDAAAAGRSEQLALLAELCFYHSQSNSDNSSEKEKKLYCRLLLHLCCGFFLCAWEWQVVENQSILQANLL